MNMNGSLAKEGWAMAILKIHKSLPVFFLSFACFTPLCDSPIHRLEQRPSTQTNIKNPFHALVQSSKSLRKNYDSSFEVGTL